MKIDNALKLICFVLQMIIILLFWSSIVHATVETGWPIGQSNTCKNPSDYFIDFEQGNDAAEVESTNPNILFTNTNGFNWLYIDFASGNYNINYQMNGNFTSWLGIDGDSGRLTFEGGPASYVSLLTKTYSGLTIDAYDSEGNLIASSGRAPNNLYSSTMTRLTVEAEGIAYVEIHDSGNYWTIDDLCTDAAPVCQPVPGRTLGESQDKIDLVFVMDEDYDDDLETFLENVESKIENRLGGVAPIDNNLNIFNFYYTKLEGDVSNATCGQLSTLPDNLLTQCSFADAVVVLHKETFGDCLRWNGAVGVFSAEGNQNRSFIHEGGHGLFALKDEYDSDRQLGRCDWTNYRGGAQPSNIWATEDDCRNDSQSQGWDEDQCYMFTTCQDDWWKFGDSSLADDDARYDDENFRFIMFDGNRFDNGFGPAAQRRIYWVFDQLSEQTQTTFSEPSQEKSITLNLNISEGGVFELNSNFVISSSPNYLQDNYSHAARIFSNNGSLIGEFGFFDPRLIEAEIGYSGPAMLESANFILTIPYFKTIGSADIVDKETEQLLLFIDLNDLATEQAQPGDLNSDGIIDRNDINIINIFRNQPASANPACDIDGDGFITIFDARKLVGMCTYPRCISN